jgi:hypothetical protein
MIWDRLAAQYKRAPFSHEWGGIRFKSRGMLVHIATGRNRGDDLPTPSASI